MNTRRMFFVWLAFMVVASLVMAGVMAGCNQPAVESDGEEEPLPPTPEGAVVYVANCVACHGDNGSGTSKAPAIKPSDKDEADLFVIIADGVKGTAMPGFRGRISEGEVQAVIEYLRSK